MIETKHYCDICRKEITGDQRVLGNDPIEIYVDNLPGKSLRYDICMDCYNNHVKPLFEVKKNGKRK